MDRVVSFVDRQTELLSVPLCLNTGRQVRQSPKEPAPHRKGAALHFSLSLFYLFTWTPHLLTLAIYWKRQYSLVFFLIPGIDDEIHFT